MVRLAALSATALAVVAPVAQAYYTIQGATSGIDSNTGARPFRLPIEELASSGPAWDLYIQAMQYWMSLDQTDMFSWYGIAGIHGLPNVAWDDQNNANGGSDGFYVGYGTHMSLLFPTWHRPFCMLHEEIISIYAHQIADTYPDNVKAQYQQAADSLRMPYWDWTTSATIPSIVQQPQLTINAAWGQINIDNPLYRYKWKPYNSDALDGIYNDHTDYTVRAPVDGSEDANSALQKNAQQMHDGAYQLFATNLTYNLMSNTQAADNGNGHQSLENIHNLIHMGVGGDMTYLWIAAHDPIFFLHHANVDRLFAIWQAIYPDSWMEGNQVNTAGTFYTPPNTPEDQNWPLAPFHKDDAGNMFTSNDVRDIKKLGYAYREIVDWNVTKEELSKNAITWANKLYNPNGGAAVTKRDTGIKAATATEQQYVLNLVVDKSKFNGSTVLNFAINNHTVGSYPILAGGNSHMNVQHGPASGQLGLTHSLITLGCNLADKNGTLNTIAKGMSWTATDAKGTKIESKDVDPAAVKITVSTRGVKQTTPEDLFPEYDSWDDLAESALGQFASKVLGMPEETIKKVTDGIQDALEGIL